MQQAQGWLFLGSYRAFSHDVMLSSNMAASIAWTINIDLCKNLFTLLSIMVSPRTSPFRFVVQAHDDHVRVTAPDIQVSLRNPTAMLEDSMMSVKTLYYALIRNSMCTNIHEHKLEPFSHSFLFHFCFIKSANDPVSHKQTLTVSLLFSKSTTESSGEKSAPSGVHRDSLGLRPHWV